MTIPLKQAVRVGAYVLRQKLARRERYPLVLMLEPLFRCNLACAGCGKIDYPDAILDQRLSVEDCLGASEECGAPVVVIAGGEPLLHAELPKVVSGLLERGRFVTVCTNALLLEKKMSQYEPHPDFNWSVHLDGDQDMHDKSVCRTGVYDKAVAAIKAAKARGFRVTINCTLFNNADADKVAAFFDSLKSLNIDGITLSPGYAYERAPDQQHFLTRRATKTLFRDIFRLGKGKGWDFMQSDLFISFLCGNETYHCTPWGNPTRTVFGWQRPCYLLGEGYAATFRELMDETDWDAYGTGRYEKCADCMVHSGFEASAVRDSFAKPLKALGAMMKGPRTEGEMAPEIDLSEQRPAQYVFSSHVQTKLAEIDREGRTKRRSAAR